MNRHVICPIAIDESWKESNWSEILSNQLRKYNILDFSDWRNDENFNEKFKLLISGLELFYREGEGGI